MRDAFVCLKNATTQFSYSMPIGPMTDKLCASIGEYLQPPSVTGMCTLKRHFRCRLDGFSALKGRRKFIADFDNPKSKPILKNTDIPTVAVAVLNHHKSDYPVCLTLPQTNRVSKHVRINIGSDKVCLKFAHFMALPSNEYTAGE